MGYRNFDDLYNHVLKRFGDHNCVVIRGSVPETLDKVRSSKISFLSIDMNAVYPEKKALEHFWSKMVKGGMIVLDDYGYPGHEEQKKMHDMFAQSVNREILSLPTCQGIIIK